MTEAELMADIADAYGGTQRLADAMRINRRNVLRWQNGQNAVHPSAWAEIGELLTTRADEILALRDMAVRLAGTAAEDAELPAATDYARDRT